MSVIREQEKANARQLDALQRKNEREIKQLQGAHVDAKASIEKNQSGEIVQIRDQHVRQLNAENERKEKVILQMKEDLDKTRQMTDKELVQIKQQNEKSKTLEQQQLAQQRQGMIASHELNLDEMNTKFNEASRKIQVDGQARIQNKTEALRSEYQQNEDLYRNKIGEQVVRHNTALKTENANYQKLKDQQDGQFKQERISTNQRQQVELEKSTTLHNQTVQKRDHEFRKDVKGQDLAFEKKYAAHLKVHNENLDRLNEQNEKVITQMKIGVTQALETTAKKKDDPFFQFTELKPTVTNYLDYVEVKVDVPEHAKQDLSLTTNNKEVILNFNRRYDDSQSPVKGITNKLHKVETYTSRIATNFTLDPKSVKSSYENGVMTYTIKSA